MKIKKIVYTFLLLAVFCAGGCAAEETDSVEMELSSAEPLPDGAQGAGQEESPGETAETEKAAESCFVYICGAVKRPGVYEMKAGSRIYEAIALAGGLLKDAALNGINQAEQVTDGQMIEILTEEETRQAKAAVTPQGEPLVNINTASAQELMALSGIGEAKAANIIAYREAHGNFTSVEDILSVDGIGEGVYAKIQNQITVTQ